MKIIYIFDDEKDENPNKHIIFSKAMKFYMALYEIENLVRSYQKYHEKDDLDPLCSRLLETIRSEITESGIDEIL